VSTLIHICDFPLYSIRPNWFYNNDNSKNHSEVGNMAWLIYLYPLHINNDIPVLNNVYWYYQVGKYWYLSTIVDLWRKIIVTFLNKHEALINVLVYTPLPLKFRKLMAVNSLEWGAIYEMTIYNINLGRLQYSYTCRLPLKLGELFRNLGFRYLFNLLNLKSSLEVCFFRYPNARCSTLLAQKMLLYNT